MSEIIKVCTDYDIRRHKNRAQEPQVQGLLSKMALISSKMWMPGKVVTISFMDGSSVQRYKVREHARRWLTHANIKFRFLSGRTGMIRITFDQAGSWSTVGTDALLVPDNEPTMCYGWLEDNSDPAEYERVVVHEFGHALGCIHEHQSPATGINWNKEAVYRYYQGAPNFWSKEEVDWNLFEKYDQTLTQFSAFDNESIMAYPVPKEFTLDGFSVPFNSQLSTTDKSFIKAKYPK